MRHLRTACVLALAALTTVRSQVSIRYRAAVVEIAGDVATPLAADAHGALQQELRNAHHVLDHWAGEAAKQGAQIVVFPEDFLDLGQALSNVTTAFYAVPLPAARPGVSLCKGNNNWTSVAEAAACTAKKWGIIIVSGIGDTGPCSTHKNPFNNQSFPCDFTTGLGRFNSMAAFGRDGSLLAKYHKAHLADSRFNPEVEPFAEMEPEVVTFDSHFGVRFGMLICNDANFGGPVHGILKAGVRDILFSTAWINTSPQLLGPSFQDSFSRAHGVNFIASNTDSFGFNSAGSGIWPANTSAPFVQHFSKVITFKNMGPTKGWMGVLDLESSPVPRAIPEPVAHPKGAATLGDKGSIDVTIVNLKAGSPAHISASVPGVQCNLEAKVTEGSGAFGLIASAGIHCMGWYSAKCTFISCPDGLSGNNCSALLTSCAKGSVPGDPDQRCFHHMLAPNHVLDRSKPVQDWASKGPRFGAVKIRISAPGTNVFFPSGQCGDYMVAEPRSTVSFHKVGDTEGVLQVAAGACDTLGAYYVDARAQEESEEAEARTDGTASGQGSPDGSRIWVWLVGGVVGVLVLAAVALGCYACQKKQLDTSNTSASNVMLVQA